MKSLTKRVAMAALAAGVSVGQASAQNAFCTPSADGKMTISFGKKPALVVNDETLDVSFEQAGLPTNGDPQATLFSFARTIDAILISAGVFSADAPDEDRQASRIAFLDTMIASFDPNTKLRLNAGSAVLVPVDDRGAGGKGEGKLLPADLLDPANANGMIPLALFNRVDLAPQNWAHCGEFRVVYGKQNPGFENRFLLIFEAVVPNPTPSDGQAGCLPFLGEWASLSPDPGNRIDNAKKLSAMYYDGITAGGRSYGPVISYGNLGGDGSGGQVRGNLFMALPWQLREWLTQLTLDGSNVRLAFVPETVKDNPIAELYLDDLASNPRGRALEQANIPVVLDRVRADFIAHFTSTVQNNLFVERSEKYSDRLKDIDRFSNPDVSVDSVSLNMIGLGSGREFDEFQSTSDVEDNIASGDNSGPKFKNLLEHLLARPESTAQGGGLPGQNVTILLNRALAGTCAGCHETAPGSTVKIKTDGTELKWPATPGFVHVTEDRLLSDALENDFLPFRRLVLAKALCAPDRVQQPSAAASVAYVDDIIREGQTPIVTTSMGNSGPVAALGALVPEERREKVLEIARRNQEERAKQQNSPGAFVEVRRPH